MMSASKIARRRATATLPAPRLPDAVLRDDWRGELGSPRQVVSEVEARVFSGRLPRNHAVNNRSKAAEMHREADRLYFKGDYESALVLYHRAAKLCPREPTHAVAARRAEVAIKRAANPSRRLGRMLREARVPGQEAAVLDPEAAARRAREIVAEAEDPVEEIPRILRYLDSREDFWRISSPMTTPRVARSRSMRRQLDKCVRSTVKDVEAAQDSDAIRKLSEELLSLVSLTEEPNRNQVDALGYLATKQLALGRHDRAIDLATRMLFRARTDNDTAGIVKALATIGRVHLTFGHLSALARVWQRLVGDLSKESIAQAWLYHDIGRCQFELDDYASAHESACRCIERAEAANCAKWRLRGYLLSGQSLLKSARLVEAVAALKVAARIAAETEREEERSILLYVLGLIDQVTRLLRRLNEERDQRKRAACCETEEEEDSEVEEDLEEMRAGVTVMGGGEHRRVDHPPPQPPPLQSHSQEEVARLLARTRALRRDNGHPEVPPVDLSDVVVAGEALGMDTSRTRVIRREEEDPEQTLARDELIPLGDFSVEDDLPSEGEERDFAEGVDEAKSKSYLELTSRSFVSSLDSPKESPSSPPAINKPIRTNILSDYLRSLESQEFLAQERQYIAGIRSAE